ncbi:hypothetical protein KIPE111705_45115 [Kibdelosporangium persicum]
MTILPIMAVPQGMSLATMLLNQAAGDEKAA